MSVVTDFEPKLLWKYFDAIAKIPRPSGREERAAEWVISIAKELGLEYERDESNNVLIRKPASPGKENAPTIVFQNHLDMVCEKNSDTIFDFDTEAIRLVVDGEWLKADGTTLGADNGIGVASALAILEDDSIEHGPIEALFTTDEERGLNGAMTVSKKWLKGRIMINMDSEDIGLFSIGCAGGRDTHVDLDITKTNASGDTLLEIKLFGLRGGHSGVDIHEGRGNALKILNRLLYQLNKHLTVEIADFKGGDKHNAIPREAFAKIVVKAGDVDTVKKFLSEKITEIQEEFKPLEKSIDYQINTFNESIPQVLDKKSQTTFTSLLFALPHGVLAMSRAITTLVETSNNVAAIKIDGDVVKFHLSSRSSNMAALQATTDKLVAIADLAGAKVHQPEGYPGWQPNVDSPILKVALETYERVAGEKAEYEAIHAGLECGLIGEKFPGMDMISVGPTIKNPHSPDECVHIGSIKVFYDHVVEMVQELAK